MQEALASGVPAIVPDAGGPRDLVAHCRNGYRLPVDRFVELLPRAVDALLAPGVRDEFGGAARSGVLGRTWPVLCDELFAHYRRVQGLPAHALRRAA